MIEEPYVDIPSVFQKKMMRTKKYDLGAFPHLMGIKCLLCDRIMYKATAETTTTLILLS
jgi:hypothetical protein